MVGPPGTEPRFRIRARCWQHEACNLSFVPDNQSKISNVEPCFKGNRQKKERDLQTIATFWSNHGSCPCRATT